MREVYFDNGATTRAFPEVVDIMKEVLETEYGQWKDKMRATLFNKYMQSGMPKYDISGNVDKRVENYLTRKTSYTGW